MTDDELISRLRDLRQIAVYLYWQSQPGDKLAQEIIDRIHKSGDRSGVWVQMDAAIEEVEKRLHKREAW